jgi:hypothetical protein
MIDQKIPGSLPSQPGQPFTEKRRRKNTQHVAKTENNNRFYPVNIVFKYHMQAT